MASTVVVAHQQQGAHQEHLAHQEQVNQTALVVFQPPLAQAALLAHQEGQHHQEYLAQVEPLALMVQAVHRALLVKGKSITKYGL